MKVTLDVRAAVQQANAAFRRYWLPFSLPLVIIGVAMSAGEVAIHRLVGKGAAIWVGLLPILVCVMAYYLAELVVATMYLDMKVGAAPSLVRARRATRYRGSWGVLWGLIGRYAGWGLVVGLGTIVVLFLWFVVMGLVKAFAGRTSGIGAVAGGTSSGVMVVVFSLLFAIVYSRYLFVVPTVALLGDGAGPRVIGESEDRTKLVRGTAVLLAVAESLPGLGLLLLQRFMFPGQDAYHGARIGTGLAAAVLLGMYYAWFLVARTELAGQLLEQTTMISRAPGGVPGAGALDRRGLSDAADAG